jgi:periplasmic copper chaperone A
MKNTATTPARRWSRRALKIGGGLALTAGLVLAAPLAASAHVTVSPDTATAGDYSVLTFAFSHGCEQSPTASLTIDVPEGVASIAPQIEPGWTIARVGGNEGIPEQIVYTADTPIESGLRATVTVQVNFTEEVAGTAVAFPVLQSCVDGVTDWSEIADAGQDPHDLDAPAPTVVVGAASADDDSVNADDTASDEVQMTDAAATGTAVTIVLGCVGLALGAAAFVIAIVALRRTRKS